LQLAVVIASLARDRSSLAIGNVVGSAISNILGAFSLGLLTHKQGIKFDRSSRIYSALLLLVTTFVAPLTYFPRKHIWIVCGSILLALFVLYVVSVTWAIGRGKVTAPEGSDSDSSDDDSSDSDNDDNRNFHSETIERTNLGQSDVLSRPQAHVLVELSSQRPVAAPPPPAPRRTGKRLRYHVGILFLGFFSISLAGYVLSHAATTITDQFDISDVLFGVVILALATTLPEKFIAVLSGFRGHAGIMVANTAGSNIFLLSLCMGIIMVQTEGEFDAGLVKIPELCVMWGSTLAFTATIWFGGRWSRWVGGAMLACYIAFIILEFTVIHKV
jgi:Ca2+/Na+ antiporter